MNVEYRFWLPLAVDQAWPIVLNMRRVVPCVPGASIESGDDQEFVGRIRIKLGPIEMTYRGTVRLIRRDDVAHEAMLSAAAKEVKGAGSVSATVTIRLNPAAAGSEVTVLSEFTVSGKAAQFGGSVISDVGANLFKEFANRLATRIMSDGVEVQAKSHDLVPQTVQAALSDPLVTVSTPAIESQPQNEALDLVAVAWWPVVKRWMLPAGVVLALVAWLLTHVISSHA